MENILHAIGNKFLRDLLTGSHAKNHIEHHFVPRIFLKIVLPKNIVQKMYVLIAYSYHFYIIYQLQGIK